MKIAIIDDSELFHLSVVPVLRSFGHDVSAFLVRRAYSIEDPRVVEQRLITGKDPAVIIRSVKEYEPDLLLLDNNLGLGNELEGDYFARELELPIEKIIGISALPQRYCGQHFRGKVAIEEGMASAINRLLEMIK